MKSEKTITVQFLRQFYKPAFCFKDVETVREGLQLFLIACSWGGHESLVFPTCALYDSQNYYNPGLPWNLVRFYIGLEEPEVLIEDIGQALNKM